MDLRSYFTFSKRERIGIITMMLIMIGLAILPRFWKKPPPKIEVMMPAKQLDYETKMKYSDSPQSFRSGDAYSYNRPYKRNSYYDYHPSKTRWKNYEHKESNNYYPHENYYAREQNHPARGQPEVIDINTADTTAFISLPGIGSKLASRIILFREKLGGFYSIDQLSEVYGIQDSAFRKFRNFLKCDPGSIKKLNINEAGQEILKQHPYIRWNLANSLVAYRNAHGPFSSVEDLKKLNNIDSVALKKLIPYLRF